MEDIKYFLSSKRNNTLNTKIKNIYYLPIIHKSMGLKQELLESISKQIKEEISLEVPPNLVLGDFAMPCFRLSKKPIELQQTLKLPKFIEKTEVKGPYLNFFIKQDYLAEITIKQILKEKQKYGSNQTGKNKHMLIEHTSINPNASPHLGRARNAIIGDSIVRISKFEGYKVETHYYVNDIGKQIAMLVLACKNKTPKFKDILNLYVEFNKKLEKNKEIEKEVFTLLNKLEQGDKKTISSFKRIVKLCIKGQTDILKELNIKYDFFDYESKFLFNKSTEDILKQLKSKNKLFTDEEGRQTLDLKEFDLPMENPYLPVTRNDGTSMYILRDIAYTIWKDKRAKDRNVWVLGEDHKLYYQQLKAILSLLNHKVPEAIHYSYILLPSGKMSTRKGDVVLLEDFMEEIKEKAKAEIKNRHGNIKEINKLSEIIAYGAVKFTILKVSADKNIVFDIEKALSFEGETAPYIQYAYARANSIIKKAKLQKGDYSALNSTQEKALISKLAEFPEVVKTTIQSLKPHLIANYSLELAKNFNEFYHACQVLNEQEQIKNARLGLVLATKQVLKNALSLLGIEVPDLM